MPLGSTTYYFDSRDDLLGQALEHVARKETDRHIQLGHELRKARSSRQLADMLLDQLVFEIDDRDAYVAEYELWLEAGRRPRPPRGGHEWCDAVQLRGGRSDGEARQHGSGGRRKPRRGRDRRTR